MNRPVSSCLLGLLLAIGAAAVLADAGSADTDAPAQALLANLRAKYPGTRFDAVRDSPIAGLFEVAMGRKVAYVAPDGRHFVFGHVFDMESQRDLTVNREQQLTKVDASGLDPGDAIEFVRGSGARVVNVFSDPTCPHCRALERVLAQLDDSRVRIYPLPILSAESTTLAAKIWCSADRANAWRRSLLDGVVPRGDAQCVTPFARIKTFAERNGIRATPALIASDGRLSLGEMSLADLSAWLELASAGPSPKTALIVKERESQP